MSTQVEFHWNDSGDQKSMCMLRALILEVEHGGLADDDDTRTSIWDWRISERTPPRRVYFAIESGQLRENDMQSVKRVIEKKAFHHLTFNANVIEEECQQHEEEMKASVSGKHPPLMGWQTHTLKSLTSILFTSYIPVLDLLRLICTYVKPMDCMKDGFKVIEDQLDEVNGIWQEEKGSDRVKLLTRQKTHRFIVTYDGKSDYHKPVSRECEHVYPSQSLKRSFSITAAFDGYRQVRLDPQIQSLRWMSSDYSWICSNDNLGFHVYPFPDPSVQFIGVRWHCVVGGTFCHITLSNSPTTQYRLCLLTDSESDIDLLPNSLSQIIVATSNGRVRTVSIEKEKDMQLGLAYHTRKPLEAMITHGPPNVFIRDIGKTGYFGVFTFYNQLKCYLTVYQYGDARIQWEYPLMEFYGFRLPKFLYQNVLVSSDGNVWLVLEDHDSKQHLIRMKLF